MKSMTGYGFSEAHLLGIKIVVEASSINKKGLDILINLPRNLSMLEVELRKLIQEKMSRGRVTLNVSAHYENDRKAPSLPVNIALLNQHHAFLKKLAHQLECSAELPLSFLITLPGVMEAEKAEKFSPKVRNLVFTTAKKALNELSKARQREGSALSHQLIGQFDGMEGVVKQIEHFAPQVVKRYRDNLIERVKDAYAFPSNEDDRILKEIALFADRADITEEISRLKVHLKEAKRLLLGKESAGRNLDFLIQEINREINTIGSKCNDLEISKHVIGLKTNLEKIREQVQNLE